MILWLLQTSPEAFRNVWSLDWDDAAALIIAVTALVAIFITKKTSASTFAREEKVDAGVLAQFKELFERLVRVEAELEAATLTVQRLAEEIKAMHKLEEFLQAKIHEREGQITGLRRELARAKKRIEHLEQVCRRAGINGGEFDVAEIPKR